jgi:hypothetical protein
MPTYAPFFWLFNEIGVSTRRKWWGGRSVIIDSFKTPLLPVEEIQRDVLLHIKGYCTRYHSLRVIGLTTGKVNSKTVNDI